MNRLVTDDRMRRKDGVVGGRWWSVLKAYLSVSCRGRLEVELMDGIKPSHGLGGSGPLNYP
jgi:hypothetical protein